MKKFFQLPPWKFTNKRDNHTSFWTGQGFSLFELLMVIALLTTLVLLVGSSSTWLNQLMVRAEVDNLYTTCRYLQRYAMMTGKQQELIFDSPHNAFMYHDHTYQLPKQVMFGVFGQVKGPTSTPTSSISHAITFVNNRIIFYPDGIIQSGTVYIIDTAQQYLFAITSPVSSVSYLRKYQYVHNTWQLIE